MQEAHVLVSRRSQEAVYESFARLCFLCCRMTLASKVLWRTSAKQSKAIQSSQSKLARCVHFHISHSDTKTLASNCSRSLSIDIDVLDPSAAPATGTPETGGWTSRELRKIIRGLEGLDIIGADVVEVAPAYDNQAALTQMVAADLV